MAVVAISVDGLQGARAMAQLVGAEYPVLADPSAQVTKAYGVYDLLGDGVAAPATFVLGPDRTIRWSHVGRGIGDRPSPEEILSRIGP